ncbi:MAG: F0F1 ATP synthase subunit epsilon [Rhizobium sp.]|nr:F0F1 ATP synthase subunit epsilon [Rhizobium sp.]
MADSFNFELVSPERLLLSARVTEIVLPATEGEMTVMANHAPFMTTIRPGVVTVKTDDGATSRFVVFGGFADILPSGCTLLAETAYEVSDFSRDVLSRRVELARTDLANAANDEGRLRVNQLISDLESLASVTG